MAASFDMLETKQKAIEMFNEWEAKINGSQAKFGYKIATREINEDKCVVIRLNFWGHSLKRCLEFRSHIKKSGDMEMLVKTLEGLEGMAWLNYDKVKKIFTAPRRTLFNI